MLYILTSKKYKVTTWVCRICFRFHKTSTGCTGTCQKPMSNSGSSMHCISCTPGWTRAACKKTKNKNYTLLYSISLHFPLAFDSSSSPQAAVCFLLEQDPCWASWLLYHFIYLPLFYLFSLILFSLSLYYHLFHYRHLCICGLQRARGSLNYFWPC